ncbi:hypothetical protein DPMN_077496 [Dreissena polymorpha]|uniref:Uncharacterized protein n=1 Tax=Dreissena polymorpha TaxID=45954 RepID=A0A9D3YNX7_DREPO|nr:hypothetical protein DPMN_077496 [Dreissena polymorpha]
MTSRVLTKKNARPLFQKDLTINVTYRKKNVQPPGGHVFQPTGPNLEPSPDIIGKNVHTKFHEEWTRNLTSRVLSKRNALPLGGHSFRRTITIFLTHEKCLAPGGHAFQQTGTIFEIIHDII